MKKALKRQFKVMRDTVLWQLCLTAAVCLLGIIIMLIIAKADKSMTSYFSAGTLFGAICSAMYGLIVSAGLQTYFNMEVSMGCTRREFFWSYFTVNVLSDLLCVGMLLLSCLAETRIYRALFPELGNEVDMMPYLLKFGLPAALAVTAIGFFAGTAMMKFGKKAFWVLWALGMFGCIGVPRIHDAMEEAPNSLFGMLGRAAAGVMHFIPGNIWIAAAAVVCTGIFTASFLFLRKQQVA